MEARADSRSDLGGWKALDPPRYTDAVGDRESDAVGDRGWDTVGERESAEKRGTTASASSVSAALAIAAVGTVTIAALVGVGGDFPLSDDWSYAYTTRELCTTGELHFLPWTGASLLLQAWYGAALCRLFGFSFTVLRISTLVLAATGVVGLVLLLRQLGARGTTLALATALFALNPLYVNLAFTFMTDVPFTVAAVWAGCCYAHGLARQRTRALLAGAVLATAALLIRQHGIFVAAAAAAAALLAARRPWRTRLAQAAAALVLPALAILLHHLWLVGIHGAPGGYEHKLVEAGRVSPLGLLNCAFRGLEYLGLFLAPLALALGRAPGTRAALLAYAWQAGLAALAVGLYVREGALMPYLTNVLYDLGLGALTLRDVLFLGLTPTLHAGMPLALPLTVLATAAAGRLGAVWTLGLARLRDPARGFVLLALLFLFAGSLLHTRYYFDRYLLVVVPFALAATLALAPVICAAPTALALAPATCARPATLALAPATRPDPAPLVLAPSTSPASTALAPSIRPGPAPPVLAPATSPGPAPLAPATRAGPATLALAPSIRPGPAALVLAALLGWLAIAGTHDYLAWNGARYAGLAALAAEGVPPTAIDGGMEYNAWHLAAVLGTWPSDAEVRPGRPPAEKSWWWVVDDRFVASFRPLPRHSVWREMRFRRWLIPGTTGRVLILERSE